MRECFRGIEAKQTALYQGRVKPRGITATSQRVKEIDVELRRWGGHSF